MDRVFDVAIIGGGINGCGCAADAALRGLSVILFEKNDLASKTSSNSTKLIHGGLRYLEHLEFSLVRKALKERKTLLKIAPHIVYPQAFVLPYFKHMRSVLILRLGLFLYDHLLCSTALPKCTAINRSNSPNLFKPLLDSINKGFLYYDGITDDARLTLFNALQAKKHGAIIQPHTKVIAIQYLKQFWQITVKPEKGESYTVNAKSIVNAAGPWVNEVAKIAGLKKPLNITLVKGSHIVVPQLYEGNQAYLLQNQDKRIIFAIPYQSNTLIGTTDVHFTKHPDDVSISIEEIEYLVDLTNQYFNKKLKPQDILFSWSGLRPLISENKKQVSKLSRDYNYVVTQIPALMVTVYGGKITTYRQLATEVVNQLKPLFPEISKSSTDQTLLPGASFNEMNFAEYTAYAKNKYAWLAPNLLDRYLKTYGTCMESFLSECHSHENLGKQFGPHLYQIEVDYLIREEWARDMEDILLRRTKLGHVTDSNHYEELGVYLMSMNG